VMTDVTRP